MALMKHAKQAAKQTQQAHGGKATPAPKKNAPVPKKPSDGAKY